MRPFTGGTPIPTFDTFAPQQSQLQQQSTETGIQRKPQGLPARLQAAFGGTPHQDRSQESLQDFLVPSIPKEMHNGNRIHGDAIGGPQTQLFSKNTTESTATNVNTADFIDTLLGDNWASHATCSANATKQLYQMEFHGNNAEIPE